MTSKTTSYGQQSASRPASGILNGLFAGRKGRVLRENLTAYLFLTPALAVIFLFGMFPIMYAGYVSLYNWRIRQGEYRGLQNFVGAMGDVVYVFFALLVLGLLVAGILMAKNAFQKAQEKNIPVYVPIIYLAPGVVIALGLLQFVLSFVTFFAQEQAIAAGEAAKLGSVPLGLVLVLTGFAASWFLDRWQHQQFAASPYSILPNFATPAVSFVVMLGIAIALAIFVYNHYANLEPAAGMAAALRVRYLSQALVALVLAYMAWSWGMRQESILKWFIGVGAGAGMIGAAYYLFDIWPAVSRGADPKFYQSLQVTVFYSVGTVPIQIAIAMVLAYILFQNIHGKGFFRVVFFIPYIAPAVAAAGIFQALFSLRPTGFVNNFFTNWGANPEKALLWLKEPGSALSVLGQAFGIEAAANWTFGPSLALFVIILFNIWNFVGYNTVIFLAGLGNIPTVLYEAAEIDGAGRWGLFRNITIPLLSPTTFFLSVISVIGTFKAFNHVWVLRDAAALGTTDTVSVYFFETFFRGARFGYATAMAMVLFVIILTLTLLQNQIAARKVFYG